MALIYKDPDNIPFSGWIVSGKELEVVLNALSYFEQKKSMALFSKNVEKVRIIMKGAENA